MLQVILIIFSLYDPVCMCVCPPCPEVTVHCKTEPCDPCWWFDNPTQVTQIHTFFSYERTAQLPNHQRDVLLLVACMTGPVTRDSVCVLNWDATGNMSVDLRDLAEVLP